MNRVMYSSSLTAAVGVTAAHAASSGYRVSRTREGLEPWSRIANGAIAAAVLK
jgi:hypothetical protein